MSSSVAISADVIVIGAGISGLQAAALLQESGVSCIVLEARDRIGGKILTTNRATDPGDLSIRQEYGAAWINDSTQPRIWKLATELGLTPLIQNSDGDVIAQDLDGGILRFPYGSAPEYSSKTDGVQCIALRELIEQQATTAVHTQAEREELDAMSFEAWVHEHTNGNTRALATARVSCHAMIGCDPGEVSALFFLEYCRTCGGMMQLRSDKKHGGQYMRIREGISSFPEGLAARLTPGTIRLESPVTAVQTSPDGKVVRVTVNENGSPRIYTARRVIVSIPTPVYRTIKFNPPLSTRKAAYIRSTRYSYYNKVLVSFKRPFWRDNGLCGLGQSFTGPVSVFRDTSDDGAPGWPTNYTLTCFVAASAGRTWSTQSTEARTTAVLDQIADMFNEGRRDEVKELVVQTLESPWMGEEWSGWGCPIPTLPVGGILSRCWDDFVAPEGNLHFVGNEFSTVWRGYLDGALRTAERGVAEVLTELKGGKERALM